MIAILTSRWPWADRYTGECPRKAKAESEVVAASKPRIPKDCGKSPEVWKHSPIGEHGPASRILDLQPPEL